MIVGKYGDDTMNEDILFNLMGNETRRLILKMLASGPCYTTEIADKLNIGQKAINEHMRLLQEADIVELYIKKQSRGSPRKYFKINKRVHMEFSVGPYRFDTNLEDLLDADFSDIFIEFPQLKTFEDEAKKTQHIHEIGELSLVMSSLTSELEKIIQAKEYLEYKVEQVRQQALILCEKLGLTDVEKRVVLEVVNAGGTLSSKDLSNRLRVDEGEVSIVLEMLERKYILERQ